MASCRDSLAERRKTTVISTRYGLLILGALLAGAIALACGGGGDDDDGGGDGGGGDASSGGSFVSEDVCTGNVRVTLDSFTVDPDPATVAAGEVAFCVENIGPVTHELKVIRAADFEIKKLPIAAPGNIAVDEEKVDVVGAVLGFVQTEPVQSLTVNLEAGSYFLICNIPSHYQLGMRTAFTVQ
jgi:uncharacterized cupredoxin-like copper-binding protein